MLWQKQSKLGGSPEKLMDDAAGGCEAPDGSRIAYLTGPKFGNEFAAALHLQLDTNRY
jgi:hypothetical protein